MRNRVRWPLVLLSVLAVAGCAGRASTPAAGREPGGRQDLITQEEIQRTTAANAYELVTKLRPQWLTLRGPASNPGFPNEIQVVADGVRLGGVTTLESINPSGVLSLQFYDGPTAFARWGLGFSMGVIVISYRTP